MGARSSAVTLDDAIEAERSKLQAEDRLRADQAARRAQEEQRLDNAWRAEASVRVEAARNIADALSRARQILVPSEETTTEPRRFLRPERKTVLRFWSTKVRLTKTDRMVFTLYDDGQFSVAHETEQERFYTAGHAGQVGHDTWWEASTRRTFRSGDEWIAAVAAEPSPGSRVLAPTTSVANDVIASIAPEIARAAR